LVYLVILPYMKPQSGFFVVYHWNIFFTKFISGLVFILLFCLKLKSFYIFLLFF